MVMSLGEFIFACNPLNTERHVSMIVAHAVMNVFGKLAVYVHFDRTQ